MDILYKSKDFVREQWEGLTYRHIIYLIVFSIIISYVTEYILKVKQIKFLYYGLFIVLMIILVRGEHPVAATETVLKLAII
jgi:hypothetical protein